MAIDIAKLAGDIGLTIAEENASDYVELLEKFNSSLQAVINYEGLHIPEEGTVQKLTLMQITSPYQISRQAPVKMSIFQSARKTVLGVGHGDVNAPTKVLLPICLEGRHFASRTTSPWPVSPVL